MSIFDLIDQSPCSLAWLFLCGSVRQSFRVWIMEQILLPVCISVPLIHDKSWKSLCHVPLPADYRFMAVVGLFWLSHLLAKTVVTFFLSVNWKMKTQWYLWSCHVEAERRWVYTAAVLCVYVCVFAWPRACITVSRRATRPCRKSLIREVAYLP